MKRPPPVPREEVEQQILFAWLDVAKWRGVPLGQLCYAVPNGAMYGADMRLARIQAGKMRRTGLKRGVPDVVVPIAAGPYHGLYIELKRRNGYNAQHTPEQRGWQARLRWLGHEVRVAEGGDHAKQIVTNYLARTGFPITIGWTPDPQIDWSKWMEGGDR
jgi:hypothetical protein